MDYKSVFTNLCLELQQNRSWIKGLGKNPFTHSIPFTHSLTAVPFVRGHRSVFPWTPRNTGVYTRHPTFVTATSGMLTRLPAKLSKNGMRVYTLSDRRSKIKLRVYTASEAKGLKIIYIHCDQISTSENCYNGTPSTVLNVLPIRDKMFGKNDWIEYSSPLQKNLTTGTLNELNFKIKDSDGKDIDNHGLPIIMTIEINSNYIVIMSICGPNFTSESTKNKDTFEKKKTYFGKITVGQSEEAESLTLFDDQEAPVVIYWSHQNKRPFFVFCLLHPRS